MRILLIVLALFWPMTVFADEAEEDRGYIAGLLEDALGGDGRTVRIEGFAGALRATSTVERITIADGQGIWLTLEDVELKWTRSALLEGRVVVDKLSARRIALPRLPVASGTEQLPAPEATPFKLPELPVSIEIDSLTAESIEIGAPVLGEDVVLTLEASVTLIDGEGKVSLQARRTDGKLGQFDIAGEFVNATRALNIDVALEEGPAGIAVRKLNVPGAPSARLAVKGTGTLSDFAADLQLATDGTERFGGTFRIQPQDDGGTVFEADLKGDLRQLMIEDFHGFFGSETVLSARGARAASGELRLDGFAARTAKLSLNGTGSLRADGWPQRISVQGTMRDQSGQPVRLPVGGTPIEVSEAVFNLTYDETRGEAFSTLLRVTGLHRDGIAVRRLSLDGLGTIAAAPGGDGRITGTFDIGAKGFESEDAALQRAVGSDFSGALDLRYVSGQPIVFPRLRIEAGTTRLEGRITVNSLAEALRTQFDATLESDDLKRFSGLAGRDLSGAAAVRVQGEAALGGAFDVQVVGTTRDIAVSLPQADALLAGAGRVDLDVARDTEGFTVRRAHVATPELEIDASGTLSSAAGAFVYDARLADIGKLVAGRRGALAVQGRADMTTAGWLIDTRFDGPYGSSGKALVNLRGPARVSFDAKLPDVSRLGVNVPGPLALQGTAEDRDGGWQVDTRFSGPYGSSGRVQADLRGDVRVNYDARLPDMRSLGAPFGGPLSLDGRITQDGATWSTDTRLLGPAGTTASVEGRLAPSLALAATGNLPLGLLNPLLAPRSVQGQARFDLAVNGPSVAAISGRIDIAQDMTVVLPSQNVTLRGAGGRITLRDGRARLDLSGKVRGGGRFRAEGGVTLSGGLPADILVTLDDVKIEDPMLYESDLTGEVRVTGPLRGGGLLTGRLTMGRTEIVIPNTFVGALSDIADVRHIGATRPVMRTQERAGLLGSDGGGGNGSAAAPFRLDFRIKAPSRIFVRGRGLDAELGGEIRLAGTTDDVVSTGGAELVRGRLDILGERFTLDEGRVQLLGDFDPFIRFVATTATASGTASVVVEGRASSPEVRFTSEPELPQDEVLSQLLFGRDLAQISPVQALELANAVATLAGRGGVGIVSRLRDAFRLDDLDVSSNAEGQTQVTVGKYLSENVYTDVTVDQDANTDVSINIDLNRNLTARGTVKSDGNTSLGIFFEKDY